MTDAHAQMKPLTRRQEKAYRILDAAAELILRWGYDKTTVDDIARQAGVAKGTIYLYWKTREELFRTLIKREQVELGEDFRQRLAADPEGVTLRSIFKYAALSMMKRPLMKAVLVRDMDVLGKLAQHTYSTSSFSDRLTGFYVYLDFLGKHGLVRQDLSVQAQVATTSSVTMGFFLTMPLMPDELILSDEETADLIGETIHRMLETPHPISPGEKEAVSRAFMEYLDRVMAVATEELHKAVG